ncbi:MAG: DMT family transporter [Burkholderiaceae bacterium]|jgi:drug/metabolite transporter (DMT)-like permease
MPLVALGLVIIAAVTHASWNILAKKAANARHFNWFYSAGSTLLFFPAASYVLVNRGFGFSWEQGACLAASAFLHLLYSTSLQRGYRVADLSVVYPVARGTGPLLSFCGAIFLLKERPSIASVLGALAVVVGVFVIARGARLLRPGEHRKGLGWGVLTGSLIASYTLTDGYAVKELALSPILVDYAGNLVRTIVLWPGVWRERARARAEYRHHWKSALGVSVLGPLGYILILFAMRLAPVSHVAPARELSMMIGAFFGAKVLGEGHVKSRIAACALIVAGVAALALGY